MTPLENAIEAVRAAMDKETNPQHLINYNNIINDLEDMHPDRIKRFSHRLAQQEMERIKEETKQKGWGERFLQRVKERER